MSQPVLVLCRDTRLFWAAERTSSSATSRTTFNKDTQHHLHCHTGSSPRALDQVTHHAFPVRYPQGTALHCSHQGAHGSTVAFHCRRRQLVRQQLLGAVVQQRGALGGQRHHQAAETPSSCQRGCRSGVKQGGQNRVQQACTEPHTKVDGSTGSLVNRNQSTSCTESVRHLCRCPPAGVLQWSPAPGPVSPVPGGSRQVSAGQSTRPRMKL